MFAQRTQENVKAYNGKPTGAFLKGTNSSPEWRHRDDLLSLCRENGIQMDLVIYPHHAHLLELIRLSGLWPQFEAWKLELRRRIDDLEPPAGAPKATLWDISAYHRYATEAVPRLRDSKTSVDWYWELGHFKKELGEETLKAVFSRGVSTGFCVKLAGSNIDTHLRDIRKSQTGYETGHADDVSHLERLVAAARGRTTAPQ